MRKRGPEKDIDGRIPFKPGGMKQPTKFAIVSVKGGKLKADDVRALASIAHNEKATSLGFGILVTLQKPTKGMRADAAHAGVVEFDGKEGKITFPAVQIITVGT
jgi:hypothetical protein